MKNRYEFLIGELTDHLKTLEKYAGQLRCLHAKDEMILAPALYSLVLLFEKKAFCSVIQSMLRKPDYREVCLCSLARCYAVLALVYSHNAKGHLKELTDRAVRQIEKALPICSWYPEETH